MLLCIKRSLFTNVGRTLVSRTRCLQLQLIIEQINTPLGCPVAQVVERPPPPPYTEAVSSPQRPWVPYHLWPFAACHSPSLSLVSCLFFSCPVQEIKVQKNIFKKNKNNNNNVLYNLSGLDWIFI